MSELQKSGWHLPSVLQQARLLLEDRINTGDAVVDATVGNGHDTLFLAKCVGETGHVYGFDIQQQALDSAKARLQAEGCMEQVTLYQAGHEQMAGRLSEKLKGSIRAVTFNLGYLPGGDKQIITHAASSLQALTTAVEWLVPGGIITAVLYNGHPGGQEEQDSILDWASHLDQKRLQVLWYQFLNQENHPPTLLAISKNN